MHRRDKKSQWAEKLKKTKSWNKAAVALAKKYTRIIWAMLAQKKGASSEALHLIPYPFSSSFAFTAASLTLSGAVPPVWFLAATDPSSVR